MSFFGLIWVASWVGSFFTSSCNLLKAQLHPLPTYSPNKIQLFQSWVTNHSTQLINTLTLQLHTTVQPPRQEFYVYQKATIRPFSASLRSPVSPLGHLLETLHSTFPGLQTFLPKPKVAAVIPSFVQEKAKTRKVWNPYFAELGSEPCPVLQPDQKWEKPRKVFQVQLWGFTIGEVPNPDQAVQIATELEEVLETDSLNLTDLQPTLIEGKPGVRSGNRILFTLDQDVTATCNSELAAITWANNLRVALAQPPLSLVEAQRVMYKLQETGRSIDGLASWYGPYFHGRLTATGEIFDQNDFTAAHPTLPFDTFLKVTNLKNGRSVIVRINDRGPYFENRSLDLSREAARSLNSEEVGVVPYEAEIMRPTLRPVSAIARLSDEGMSQN